MKDEERMRMLMLACGRMLSLGVWIQKMRRGVVVVDDKIYLYTTIRRMNDRYIIKLFRLSRVIIHYALLVNTSPSGILSLPGRV